MSQSTTTLTPVEDLVHRALNPDGSINDPQAYAALEAILDNNQTLKVTR